MKHRSSNSKSKHIAHHLVNSKVEHGVSKQQAISDGKDIITSINTGASYKVCVKMFLDWRQSLRLPVAGPYLADHMQEFLYEMAEMEREQKVLNSAKQALQKTYGVVLRSVESEVQTILSARANEVQDVETIRKFQSPKNRLSTKLCLAGGLRAHELLTLRRASEMEPSSHRVWDENRFAFFDEFERYTVQGKGGLWRHVAVPTDLSMELEDRRFDLAIQVKDRGIFYYPVYDIGGGQSFSQSFCTASKKALGYSNGAHGLRHSYAQKRLAVLKAHGMSTDTAMLVLSQELGHFRPDIVLAYLR